MAKKTNTTETKAEQKSYVVLAGFNYGCLHDAESFAERWGTRVEAGPLTVTLPKDVFDDLFAQGVIVEAPEGQGVRSDG